MTTKTTPPCRSALYMPASNSRALEKGPTLAADAIIIDLEDSVALEAKATARKAAIQALQNHDYGRKQTVLRVNAFGSDEYELDMAVLNEVMPDAILLPKVESANTIQEQSARLDAIDGTSHVSIWAMMETPMAVVQANTIAAMRQSCPRLSTFCIGNNDLAREAGMRITSDRTLLMPWLLQLLLAAKAYHLNILDGVYNDFADEAGFEKECMQGADMGMSGKTLIHPKQIAVANTCYSPSEQAIKEARDIVAAFEAADAAVKSGESALPVGVLQLHGKMVERLHLEMAKQTLLVADQFKEAE